MIQPVNGHLVIEPVKHEGFMASSRETYEEIGTVISYDTKDPNCSAVIGDKVYFDAWLAAKYHKEGGKPDEFYWLVKFEDVRAIEHVES